MHNRVYLTINSTTKNDNDNEDRMIDDNQLEANCKHFLYAENTVKLSIQLVFILKFTQYKSRESLKLEGYC